MVSLELKDIRGAIAAALEATDRDLTYGLRGIVQHLRETGRASTHNYGDEVAIISELCESLTRRGIPARSRPNSVPDISIELAGEGELGIEAKVYYTMFFRDGDAEWRKPVPAGGSQTWKARIRALISDCASKLIPQYRSSRKRCGGLLIGFELEPSDGTSLAKNPSHQEVVAYMTDEVARNLPGSKIHLLSPNQGWTRRIQPCREFTFRTHAWYWEFLADAERPSRSTTANDEATAMACPLGSRFSAALAFANELHGSQFRKGTSIPYVAHLLSVAALVIEHGGSEDEAIAALLHDAVEDQGGQPTLEVIRRQYGAAVADTVSACSDTDVVPKPPWKERKEHYLASIPSKSKSALLVSLADKVHNARSIGDDLAVVGEAVWGRFNGGREGTLWYYRALLTAFEGRTPMRLWQALREAVEQLESRASKSVALRGPR